MASGGLALSTEGDNYQNFRLTGPSRRQQASRETGDRNKENEAWGKEGKKAERFWEE